MHADAYEIFVMQIAGHKEWSLYQRTDPLPRTSKIFSNADFAGIKPERIVVQPGDVLYLPWGTPHRVRSLESFSAHISIALSFPTWADVLSDLTQSLLQDQRFNGPAHVAPSQVPASAERLESLLDSLSEDLAAINSAKVADALANQAHLRGPQHDRSILAQKYAESQKAGAGW